MLVLLRFLFDQLPIGILCYDQDGSLLVRNARVPVPGAGGGWATRDEAVGCLEAQGARRSAIAPDHLQYVLSAGAGQSLVDLRRIERKSGAVYTIATFGPLSGQGDVFRERLEREVYRCRWLGSPLTLVVLRSGPDPAPLLARLPELRAALGEGAFCDVLDDSGLGLIAPLRGSRETLAATRRVAGLGAVNPLTLGWSGLVGAQEDPEAMIGRALDGLRPAGALLGRRLLVFDRYRAVPDMIEMVVGGALHLDKATDPDVAGRLLEDAPYDGLIADGDATENGAGIRLLELAACRQPAIRTILSTTRMDLRPGVGPVPDRTRILNKPFTLSALRTALEGLLKPQP
jgi:hypothetical protein